MVKEKPRPRRSTVKDNPVAVYQSPSSRKRDRNYRKSIIQMAAREVMSTTTSKGVAGYGSMAKVVKEFHARGHTFVTRRKVQHQMDLMKKEASKEKQDIEERILKAREEGSNEAVRRLAFPAAEITVPSSANRSSISSLGALGTEEVVLRDKPAGRPKGTTRAAKKEADDNLSAALSSAATQLKEARDYAKSKNTKIAPGVLEKILNDTEQKHQLPAGALSAETVRTRVYRGNVSGKKEATTSPLEDFEPILVDYMVEYARMGQPLDKGETIAFASSLLEGSSFEKRLIDWKKKYTYSRTIDLLGSGWYTRFLLRHEDRLASVRTRIKDEKRVTFVTYQNFSNMYDFIYERMVEAGVARKLPNPQWYNAEGKVVETEEEAIGLKTEYEITNPDWIVMVDECGNNTNQKDDGALGGERRIVPRGEPDARLKGATTDIRYTVLCFQAGNGQPIMCAVIMKSEKDIKDIPMTWKMGIDTTQGLRPGDDADDIASLFMNNKDAMKGGPVCNFRGKTIPCFVAVSPNASITSALLAEMLSHMDRLGIWERKPDGPRPFLILDGHHSRMELPFVQYIMDDAHRWEVCIGVPYATHLWQVADSSQINGAFKMGSTRFKRTIYESRQLTGKTHFSPTDIIPIVNKAFEVSFGNVEATKKAIAQRGWVPATRALLKLEEIAKSRETDGSASAVESAATAAMASNTTRSSAEEELNTDNGTSGKMMQKLLLQAKREEGQGKLKRLKRTLDAAHQNEGIAKVLKEKGKVSSGILASNNHFGVDNHIYDFLKARGEAEAEQERKRAANRAKAKADDEKKLKAAEEAIEQGKELTVEHAKAIAKSKKRDGDSPLAKSKEGLVAQMNRRIQREKQEQAAQQDPHVDPMEDRDEGLGDMELV